MGKNIFPIQKKFSSKHEKFFSAFEKNFEVQNFILNGQKYFSHSKKISSKHEKFFSALEEILKSKISF
jgi:hypothetical protein